MDVFAAVVESIREAFPLFDGEVTPETTARDVAGWDSFGHVQLIFTIEDRLGITIDAAKTLTCQNVGELVAVVQGNV